MGIAADRQSLGPVELTIEIIDDEWLPGDPRWQAQKQKFLAELNTLPETGVRYAIGGGRGAAEAIILAVGSAGALTAAVEMFRAWCATRPSGEIEVTQVNGENTAKLRVANLSKDEARELYERYRSDPPRENS